MRIPFLRLLVWAFLAGIAFSMIAVTIVLAFSKSNKTHNSLPLTGLLRFTTRGRWNEENQACITEKDSFQRPLYSKSQNVSLALNKFLLNLQTEFIDSWFPRISSDVTFPVEIEGLLRHTIEVICLQLESAEMTEIFVAKIVPLLTSHIHDFSLAERTVRGKHLNKNLTESEEVDMAIASKYREGRLHPAVGTSYCDMQHAQQDYLRKIVDRLLPVILIKEEKHCTIMGIFLKEIIACAIFCPIMCLLSDPDLWNRVIEALGKSVLQDRKSVGKLRAALDKHATPHMCHISCRCQSSGPHTQFIRLTRNDDERTFERFIRSIRQCSHLSDARRLRNEITAQLKRDIKTTECDDSLSIYLRRLETGKRLIDQKVVDLTAALTGPSNSIKKSELESMVIPNKPMVSKLESASLEEVMQDSAGLSYFMEYMDRQHRLALVQFWLVVNGLRNPLEDDISSSDESNVLGTSFPPWTPSDRSDVAQIHDAYLSIPELRISDNSKRSIKEFLKFGSKASQVQYVRARSAVLRAQSVVYEDMHKQYFPGFRSSSLFYKYLASDQSGNDTRNSSFLASIDRERGSSPVANHDEALAVAPDSARLIANHETSSETYFLTPENDTMYSQANGDRSLYYPNIRFDYHSPEKKKCLPDRKVVESVKMALNNIIEDPLIVLDRGSSAYEPSISDYVDYIDIGNSDTPKEVRETHNSEQPKTFPIAQGLAGIRQPSIASLGLVNTETRDGFFDNELFPEDEIAPLIESPDEFNEMQNFDPTTDKHRLATLSYLGHSKAIIALSIDIQRLSTQEAVIDSLYRKAELTNNIIELRILKKSKSSLEREIKRKELQKQHYMIQESDSSLFGRSTLYIRSTMVGNEGGQEYALYIVEVYRQGGEELAAKHWAVPRRYSEFFQLHQSLKRFQPVRELEFPRRRVVMKLQREFLERRRIALDKYLKLLISIPEVCNSPEFREFLSQQEVEHNLSLLASDATDSRRDIVSRLYDSIADGVEDVLGNFPIIDQLSQSNSNVISAASTQFKLQLQNLTIDKSSVVTEAEAELSAFEDKEEPFVKPLCDLFLEVFELNRKSNWLRGRAVVVVLHQLLGGTIERKLKENMSSWLNEESIRGYIDLLSSTLRLGKEFSCRPDQRSSKEKTKTKSEASLTLATLIPELSASVVGRANAISASRRLFAVYNNQRLNTSILFIILDVVIAELFGVSVN